MKVSVNGSVVKIEGVIKTLNDVNKINEIINDFKSGYSLIIRIEDSFVIPSAIIGILMKKEKDGVDIHLEVGNEILYELLDDLNLVSLLNVKKINN
jgi:hypothetical protein